MRICLVSSSFYPAIFYGGPISATWDLSKKIGEKGVEVYVSTTNANGKKKLKNILLCGGGRKNKVLLKKIKDNLSSNFNLKLIDDYNINGDFIESQAFAFLAIRSILKLPITFPNTTGCLRDCSGGVLISN